MKQIFVAVVSLLYVNVMVAQLALGDFNTKFLEANQLMEEKQWNQSIDIWQELFASNSQNANVNYKLGYCFLQTPTKKLKAMPYLQFAANQSISPNYDPYDPKEELAPVEARYYLGRVFHLNYEMDKAIAEYNKLLEVLPEKHQLYAQALHQIEMCNNAKYQVAHPEGYLISNVGPVINQETNDFSPVVSIDESAMFFTSRRMRADSTNQFITDGDTGEFMEDIYVSYRDQAGNWQTPELLNINTDAHAATCSVSPDGQELYIYYDKAGDGQIWKSVLVGETWTEPEMLGSDINSPSWETHATVSADGNTLYFVSNRPGGKGGRDIYRCVKLPNGDWSKALNVGDVLNTPYEEDAPFLSADGRTLYFSSSGHSSMGGFDIFYSTLSDDGEWTKPVNIGYPVNTVDDDVFFAPTATGKRAYYSSRKEEGFGLKDIYVIDMPDSPVESGLAVLKGFIVPAEGEEIPEDTYIQVTNKETGEVSEYRPRMRDGGYVAVLPPCISYKIEYFVNSEIVHEEFINVPCESAYSEIDKEIYLLPVHLGGAIASDDTKPNLPNVKPGDIKPDSPEVMKDETVGVLLEGGKAYYQRYFIYDMGEWNDEAVEQKYSEFVEGVAEIIRLNGTARLLVESSASKVPSSRFRSNNELTAFRNKLATQEVTKALEMKGFKKGKDFSFQDARKLVQGPDYQNDAQERKAVYEQFQYIKIWVE
jgi:tetratricopeptide (TPR) repeat protein